MPAYIYSTISMSLGSWEEISEGVRRRGGNVRAHAPSHVLVHE